jgi:hypothetical protein
MIRILLMNDHGLNTSIDNCSSALIVLSLFTVIGFFIGFGVNYGLVVEGNNPRWRRIPTPPSPALKLVYATPGCVYIESVDEKSYFFCDKYSTDKESWQRYNEFEQHYPEISCPDSFPDHPYEALQTIEFCLGKEYIDNTQFALFTDGSIKIRRSQGGWGSLYRGVLLIFGGSVLGLFTGVGYYFYRKSKSSS